MQSNHIINFYMSIICGLFFLNSCIQEKHIGQNIDIVYPNFINGKNDYYSIRIDSTYVEDMRMMWNDSNRSKTFSRSSDSLNISCFIYKLQGQQLQAKEMSDIIPRIGVIKKDYIGKSISRTELTQWEVDTSDVSYREISTGHFVFMENQEYFRNYFQKLAVSDSCLRIIEIENFGKLEAQNRKRFRSMVNSIEFMEVERSK